MSDKQKFAIAAVGIFVCYFYFAIIQEKITRGRYGEELQDDGTRGERFTFVLALVGVQCLCNWIFAKAILIAKPQNQDTTPKVYYASSSLTYLLAMISSNMALRWVAYPMQVVAKSAKPIPVMLLGVLVGRKSYTLQKYLFVLLIVIGVVLFMFKEGKSSSAPLEQEGLGQLLLIMSLTMDGLIGAIQERMRQHSSPSAQHMMLAMNGWSTIFVIVPLLVTGEGMQFIAFATKYPQMLAHLATLALAGAMGQLFIFMMVSSFGALACSVVTTTRKFFTVLASVLLFGNSLTGRQWFGAILVFTGLFSDMLYGKKGATGVKPIQKPKDKNEAEELLK
ncbi:solute carrier family 35 member B1 homolog [Toxorhynchites rutilus septentrionalis]|uniref:solute carrier family 35 member B1 homolog n=1 Tax=Toxorhynchites rutilus septentrionalis TaxID=329112 RepID=UPI00247A621D|nr:solute carrier family 35 member B1 homolog [Toxorhynchites rutilus septentrionalis]